MNVITDFQKMAEKIFDGGNSHHASGQSKPVKSKSSVSVVCSHHYDNTHSSFSFMCG